MNNTKAYSAASATSPLASTTIPRRDATEHDVQVEILFCNAIAELTRSLRGLLVHRFLKALSAPGLPVKNPISFIRVYPCPSVVKSLLWLCFSPRASRLPRLTGRRSVNSVASVISCSTSWVLSHPWTVVKESSVFSAFSVPSCSKFSWSSLVLRVCGKNSPPKCSARR
jgi:hypothetical protein